MNFYSYISDVFCRKKELLTKSKELISPVIDDFDCFVGTGLSGTIFTSILAHELNKDFAIVRKTNDGTHSDCEIEGRLRKKWVFVDDFIATGKTYDFVKEKIAKIAGVNYLCYGVFLYKDLIDINFDGISNYYETSGPYRGFLFDDEIQNIIERKRNGNI